jgi:hypothetical protein
MFTVQTPVVALDSQANPMAQMPLPRPVAPSRVFASPPRSQPPQGPPAPPSASPRGPPRSPPGRSFASPRGPRGPPRKPLQGYIVAFGSEDQQFNNL